VHLGIENTHKVGAIGVPGFNWETRVVDEDGRDVPKGEPGELIAGVMAYEGILQKSGGHGKSIERRLALYGRHGPDDADGFIWIVDRRRMVIHYGWRECLPC